MKARYDMYMEDVCVREFEVMDSSAGNEDRICGDLFTQLLM